MRDPAAEALGLPQRRADAFVKGFGTGTRSPSGLRCASGSVCGGGGGRWARGARVCAYPAAGGRDGVCVSPRRATKGLSLNGDGAGGKGSYLWGMGRLDCIPFPQPVR